MNKTAKNLIISLAMVILALVAGVQVVYADCESTYGGGETCIYNKRFEIEKEVRIKDETEWEDKVTGVSKNDTIEFKIKIKNRSDKGAGDFDDMKMEDFLPDELIKTGGDGLTESWDNFKGGESETFIIEARIDSDEFDRDDNFEKCVVNKAEVRWDDNFEGADTATVCYGKGKPTELPKTGAMSDLALIGVALVITGITVKLLKRLAN